MRKLELPVFSPPLLPPVLAFYIKWSLIYLFCFEPCISFPTLSEQYTTDGVVSPQQLAILQGQSLEVWRGRCQVCSLPWDRRLMLLLMGISVTYVPALFVVYPNCLGFVFIWHRVSVSPDLSWIHYVRKDGFKLVVMLLLQPLECWVYKVYTTIPGTDRRLD